jgi:hypothetical protein
MVNTITKTTDLPKKALNFIFTLLWKKIQNILRFFRNFSFERTSLENMQNVAALNIPTRGFPGARHSKSICSTDT